MVSTMSSPLILAPRSSFGPMSAATGASAESAQASANPTANPPTSGGSDPRTGPTPTGAVASDANAVSWLLAWGVLIVLLVLINRTKLGQTITYYVLALAVLFLVLTQYKFIAATLAPFSQSQQAVTENASNTGGDQVDPNVHAPGS